MSAGRHLGFFYYQTFNNIATRINIFIIFFRILRQFRLLSITDYLERLTISNVRITEPVIARKRLRQAFIYFDIWNGTIAKVVLRELEVPFQGQIFQRSISLKRWEHAQTESITTFIDYAIFHRMEPLRKSFSVSFINIFKVTTGNSH